MISQRVSNWMELAGLSLTAAGLLYFSYRLHLRQCRCGKNEDPVAPIYSKIVKIPRQYMGLVVGRRGINLRNVEFDTTSTIEIIPEDQAFELLAGEPAEELCGPSKCTPIGEQYRYLKIEAKTERKLYLTLKGIEVKQLIAMEPRTCETIYVPRDDVGRIIGRQGRNLHRISKQFDVYLQFDNLAETETHIPLKVAGIVALVARATKYINRMLFEDEFHGEPSVEQQIQEINYLRGILEQDCFE